MARIGQIYLVCYNAVQFAGWSVCLALILSALLCGGSPPAGIYLSAGPFARKPRGAHFSARDPRARAHMPSTAPCSALRPCVE